MFREPPPRSGSLFPPRHTSAPLSAALSAAPPPEAKPMPRHFRHPGRWWQPCVTPYFADLGVGDMRGQPSRQYTSPPRRRWQAVSPTTQHTTPIRQAVPTDSVPLSALRSPPRYKQRKPCHRGTRTLNPLADRAAAPSKPNFHHPTQTMLHCAAAPYTKVSPQGAAQRPPLLRIAASEW